MKIYKMKENTQGGIPSTATLMVKAMMQMDNEKNYSANSNRILESYGIDTKITDKPEDSTLVSRVNATNPLIVLSMLSEQDDKTGIAEVSAAIDNLDRLIQTYHSKYSEQINESLNKAVKIYESIKIKK